MINPLDLDKCGMSYKLLNWNHITYSTALALEHREKQHAVLFGPDLVLAYVFSVFLTFRLTYCLGPKEQKFGPKSTYSKEIMVHSTVVLVPKSTKIAFSK